MKKTTIISFLSFILILTGCSSTNSNESKITEEQAKQIIIEEYSRDYGELEIISVINESDKYIIQWEIDPIVEGKDSINKITGKLKTINSSVGTCKWK